jgi:Fe-S cluster assembly iron-binding protein IscA
MMKFTVTPTAKAKLTSMIKTSEASHHYESLVPAILWGSDTGSENFAWMIGFYEKKRIVADWLISLDGVEFYVDPIDLPKLDGKTLDYISDTFKVR